MNKKYIFIIITAVILVAVASYFLLNKPPLTECGRLYDEIENDMDVANYCDTASDCEVLILGGSYIEFGCYHFINKEVDKQLFYDKMETYSSQCSMIINECAPAPEAECIDGKCVFVGE